MGLAICADIGQKQVPKCNRADVLTDGTITPLNTYSVNANPVTLSQSGQRFFYSDVSGVIRYNTSATASSSDGPLN